MALRRHVWSVLWMDDRLPTETRPVTLFDPRDWDETLRDASYCPRARDRRHQRQRIFGGKVVCTFCGCELESKCQTFLRELNRSSDAS